MFGPCLNHAIKAMVTLGKVGTPPSHNYVIQSHRNFTEAPDKLTAVGPDMVLGVQLSTSIGAVYFAAFSRGFGYQSAFTISHLSPNLPM
jgi:hypothetical protein